MVALIAKLWSLGVTLHDSTAPGLNHAITDVAATDQTDLALSPGNLARKRNPYALLTHRDEIELGRRIQLSIRIKENLGPSQIPSLEANEIIRRGLTARDKLVVANLRLVRFAIRNVTRPARTLDPWDLFQEGVTGLMRAVEKFDPELGLKFSTYAMWWIRQAIFRGLDDSDRTIRVPAHRLESIRRMRFVTRRLAHELGREPTIRELADGLNWPMEKTLFIQRLTQLDCISLDTPVGEDGGLTIGDLVVARDPGPFEFARETQRSDVIRRFLVRLTPRQQLVIERRFGLGESIEPQTLQQVGDHLSLTRERVRQIEAIALRRLRKWVNRRMHDALL
jgi:RNA polymerase primary sigma factor